MVGAKFIVEEDPVKLAHKIIEGIEKKRVHFEALVEEKMLQPAEA